MSDTPPPVAPLAALATALADARKAAPTIAKRAKNDAHGFNYAEGEDVIEACRNVLAAHGLSLLPVRSAMREPTKSESIGLEGKGGRYGVPHAILCGSYLLLHKDGAQIELYFETPVVPERGRPLDKATFAADTEQLAYAHRDVLGAKRGTTLDVAGREDSDDHGDQPRGAPPATPAAGPRQAPAQRGGERPRQAPPAAQPARQGAAQSAAALVWAPGRENKGKRVGQMVEKDLDFWIRNITTNPGEAQYRVKNAEQLAAMLDFWAETHQGVLHPVDRRRGPEREPGDDDERYEGVDEGGGEDDIPY